MRDELLALLEEGPSPMSRLARLLDQPMQATRAELTAMATERLVHCRSRDGRWRLGPRPQRVVAPPAISDEAIIAAVACRQPIALVPLCRALNLPYDSGVYRVAALVAAQRVATQPLTNGGKKKLYILPSEATVRLARPARERVTAATLTAQLDHRLGIEEPSSGTRLCLQCFTRFFPAQHGDDFCSKEHRQLGPAWAPPQRTVMVDGVEFESTSVGRHSVTQWPDHDIPRGSSLSDAHTINRSGRES